MITLDKPLKYMHYGLTETDGFGGTVDQRTEVALLTRNIVITGTDEPAPSDLDGDFCCMTTQGSRYMVPPWRYFLTLL